MGNNGLCFVGLLLSVLAVPAVVSAQPAYPDSVIATVSVGGDPTDVCCPPGGDYVYVANEVGSAVTVVRISTRTVVGSISTGSAPWQIAASPDGQRVAVSNHDGATVSFIRTSDRAVEAQVSVEEGPHTLTFSPDGQYVYVSCDIGKVCRIRVPDHTVVARVPVGSGPRGVCVRPDGQYVYVTNYEDGTMSVIRCLDDSVKTVGLPVHGHRDAASADGEFIYFTAYAGSQLYILRTSDNMLDDSVAVGSGTLGISVIPGGAYAVTANVESNNISVVRCADRVLEASIPVGSGPFQVCASSDGDYLFTANRYGHTVTVIARRRQVHDVGPTQILAPPNTVDSGVVIVPRVAIRNFGPFTEVFPVTLRIGVGYDVTVNDTLAAGQSDTVVFPAWVAGPVGSLPLTCYTGLLADENRANDTVRGAVQVIGRSQRDVGALEILAPRDSVDSGFVVYPQAVVRNFGTGDAVFPVVMTIAGGYSVLLSETLAAGRTDTISFFPSWTAGPVGLLPVTCFSGLAGDENPANDTVRGAVRVTRRRNLDAGAVDILVPSGLVDSGTVHTPRAVVRNYGLAAAVFPVTFTITGGYTRTVSETLAAGALDTVSFPSWTAFPVGILSMTCFTSLAGDENPANDTVREQLQVRGHAFHDMSATLIVEPVGQLVVGDTVRPKARITNLGREAERSFDVVFRVGNLYRSVQTVVYVLPSESTRTVVFDLWTAVAGDYIVSCSTMLAADENRGNDKTESWIRVTQPARLLIVEDQTDRIGPSITRDYRFHAVLYADSGGVVDLESPGEVAGWSALLYDSAGTQQITSLGRLEPREMRFFALRVQSPGNLGNVADTGVVFRAAGHLALDTTVRGSALLRLLPAPDLSVHNYPNPFSLDQRTTFWITLPEQGKVTLTVYDRAGTRIRQVLKQEQLDVGTHRILWIGNTDGGHPAAPGAYDYVLDYEHGKTIDRIRKKLVVARD